MKGGEAAAWEEVRQRMADAARRSGREPEGVTLLAVSKSQPLEAVVPLVEAGQAHFGESRYLEGESKIRALPQGLVWHYLGGCQRNKVRKILPLFPVIHSVSSRRLAEAINRIAGELGLRPCLYAQINLAGEEAKGGFEPEEFEREVEGLQALESVEWEGLMILPPQAAEAEASRKWFAHLRELRDRLVPTWGGLSMGMSGDFEVAIEEGASIVRVGTQLFGEREKPGEGEHQI